MFNILIIEDDDFIRNVYQASLENLSNDITVYCANNGEVGIELLKNIKIDFIILDLMMEKGDGVYVLRNLSSIANSPSVILCSSVETGMLSSISELAAMYNVNILGMVKKPELPITLIYNAITESKGSSNIDDDISDKHDKTESSSLLDIKEYVHNNLNTALSVFYQPQICLKSKGIVGFESLVRLMHPKYGVLLPYQFLPYLDSDEFEELTWQVVNKTFRQQKLLRKKGYNLNSSINIPPKIMENITFPEKIQKLALNYDLPQKSIVLEMLEGTNVDNKTLLDVCTRLRLKGFNLSIDDFGENQSSFDRFKRFPFNEIKIDRKFIVNLTQDDKKVAIVSSLIKLGKELNIPVIAEGVETDKVLEKLTNLGCDLVQGYLISPPVNDIEFIELLNAI
ncbi:EAL domain-containing protein [Shewanella sp. 10N.261.52.F9]|uniref:EAL domain-containing response regulator n=1 Tax=Shewanella sp. 10N.261.52.F9 TaxID=3229684 RepID=UPI00354D3D66